MKERTAPPLPRRPWRALAVLAGAAGLLVAAAGLWLLGTAAGARFALERGVALAGAGSLGKVEGRLVGPLALDAISLTLAGTRVRAERVTLDWSPVRLLAGELHVVRLHAATLEVMPASSGEPARMPATLALPLRLRVEHAGVDRLRVASAGDSAGGVALRDVSLQLAADGESWRVASAEALAEIGRARFSGSIGAKTPFAIALKGELAGSRGTSAYRATVAASGTLAGLDVSLDGGEDGLSGNVRATVEPFAALPLRSLKARLSGLDLAAFTAAPRTSLDLDADLSPHEGAILSGPVKVVNTMPGTLDRQRLPVASATAQLTIATGRFEARNLAVVIAGGGSAQGQAVWSQGKLDAHFALREGDLLAWHSSLRATKLAGDIRAVATGESQSYVLALADPRFEIRGDVSFAGDRLVVQRARLSRGAAVVEASGALALGGSREFTVEGHAEHFDPAAFAKVPAGELNATFKAAGRLAKPMAGEVSVEVVNSHFAGLAAQGRIGFAAQGTRVDRVQAEFSLGATHLAASGALGREGDSLEVRLTSPDLAPIGRAFGRSLAGSLDFDARVSGQFAALSGRGSLAAKNLVLPGATRVASVTANVEIGAGDAGGAQGRVEISNVVRHGETRPILERASAAIRGTRASHDVRLDASLVDGLGARALLAGGVVPGARLPEWRGRLESLETTGPAAFSLAAPVALDVSAQRVELGEALFAGDVGSVHLAVTRWTPSSLESRGSSSAVVVRTIRDILKMQGEVGSNLVLAGDWDVRLGESMDGYVSLRRERGDVRVGEPRQALGLEELAIRVDAVRGRLKATLDIRGKQAGSWKAEAAATMARGEEGWAIAPREPIAGRFSVDVPDLAWMAAWIGPEARLAGHVRGEGSLAGTQQDPTWGGRIEATGLSIREPTLGAEVADGTIAIALKDREARIERFTLTMPWQPTGGAARAVAEAQQPSVGTITAEGAVDLGTRKGSIRVRSAGYPITRLETRFVAVSGEGSAEFDGLRTTLAGNFTADAGWFGIPAAAPPSLSEDVIVVRTDEVAAAAKDAGHVRLDLRVDLGRHLYFEGRGLSTRLAGSLRLAGALGAGLRTTGTIRAEGGTFDAYGRTLAIERGALTFQGAIDNPALNVLALRKGLPVEAGVEVTGTVARPRVRLASSPDVPESEKLAWLVLGRGRGDVSSADAALLVGAANAILGKETIPAARLISGLGLDEVSVGNEESGVLGAMPQSTVAGRTGGTSSAEVVTVGKQLSDKIRVSYKQGLADAEGSFRVALQFTQKLQFILRAGYEPGIDAVYRFNFK